MKIHVLILFVVLLPGCMNRAMAQTDTLEYARRFVLENKYEDALAIYKFSYEKNGTDIYAEYLSALISAKKYKEAEKLVSDKLKTQPGNPMIQVDLGRVLDAEGKNKKAADQYNAALLMVNGDDMLTQQLVNSFMAAGKENYAISVYEKAKSLLGGTFIYNVPLAKLYAKTGDIDKEVGALIDMGPMQYLNTEGTKGVMLELLGSDPQKLQLTQKALIKKINAQPEILYYVELLTWLYTQKNDWDGALIQIEALDERSNAKGQRLIDFARSASRERQFDIAIKSYEEVKEKGKDQPFYTMAYAEQLNTSLAKIQADPFFRKEDAIKLANEYDSFLTAYPQYYGTQTASDLAMVEAQFADNPAKAILILKTAIKQPGATHEFLGKCALQLGDYYILVDKVWEASLMYSQVDKEFKVDMLGEEARFRNAKVAFYVGDFDWAQTQLSVLKASTSQLIANDALYLSVLITENTPPDSNFVPLRRYAAADLLLFQNKDKDALSLLDSINTAFPKDPLNDDILMLRAKIAVKHKEYDKALGYYKEVFEKYKEDVLGDDAVYLSADIYETYLHKREEAKHFYEQLIIDYPGSTYVQNARKKLEELSKAVLP